jgi:hypothetical protein
MQVFPEMAVKIDTDIGEKNDKCPKFQFRLGSIWQGAIKNKNLRLKKRRFLSGYSVFVI